MMCFCEFLIKLADPCPSEEKKARQTVLCCPECHDSIPYACAEDIHIAYESLMVGFFTIWRGQPEDRHKPNNVVLGYSRDLKNGKLYAFWVSPENSGASRG